MQIWPMTAFAMRECSFNRPDFDLASAIPGSFTLTPHDGMLANLRRDYANMSGMIFGAMPAVEEVVATVSELERCLNSRH
jgi:hypothetical protein